MEESFSFKFYLNRAKSEGTDLKIYGRLIVVRKKAELYTGFLATKEEWNNNSGRTYKNIAINQELSAIENKIYEIRRKLIDEEKPVTAPGVIERLKGKKNRRIYLLKRFLKNKTLQTVNDNPRQQQTY